MPLYRRQQLATTTCSSPIPKVTGLAAPGISPVRREGRCCKTGPWHQHRAANPLQRLLRGFEKHLKRSSLPPQGLSSGPCWDPSSTGRPRLTSGQRETTSDTPCPAAPQDRSQPRRPDSACSVEVSYSARSRLGERRRPGLWGWACWALLSVSSPSGRSGMLQRCTVTGQGWHWPEARGEIG